MKSLLIAVLALTLSGCSLRGALTDEYTSWEEARRALETEIEYRIEEEAEERAEEIRERVERIREDFAEFYVKVKAIRVLIDEDSLRDWLDDWFRREIGM